MRRMDECSPRRMVKLHLVWLRTGRLDIHLGVISSVPHLRPAPPHSLLATSLPTMTSMGTIPRPVVDQTGLVGLYDFTLRWESSPDPDTGDTTASFRGVLKSQLGLSSSPPTLPSTSSSSTTSSGLLRISGCGTPAKRGSRKLDSHAVVDLDIPSPVALWAATQTPWLPRAYKWTTLQECSSTLDVSIREE